MSTPPPGPPQPVPPPHQPSPEPPPPPPSSGVPIILGVVLLVVGQMVYANGQQVALEAALTPSAYVTNDGQSTLLVGGIMTLVGLIVGLLGVARLCQRVDFLHYMAGGR